MARSEGKYPDPSPRQYPAEVTLLRRANNGAACAPAETTAQETEDWLLGEAVGSKDLLFLFEQFVWRLVACGFPVDRASIHIGTLHPLLLGFAWNWNRLDGLVDEVKVSDASRDTDAFRQNPLYRVIALGERVRARTDDPEALRQYPLLRELAQSGYSEYIALPLVTGGTYHNAVTLATQRAGGFDSANQNALRRLFRIFALHVERQIAIKVANNALATYLGEVAAQQVLGGSIRRGSGELIHSIIWVSDLRGFTDLTDNLPGSSVTAILNAYFEHMAGAVIAHGGEVLKFIGDGLLAVFPFSDDSDAPRAAQAALQAAEAALAGIALLNRDKPTPLDEIGGWHPLRTGIALHEGEAFFGNVGAPERLDFTVIGRAINIASRTEALTKTLARPVLLTAPVARRINRPLVHLGKHNLRGLVESVSLYGLDIPSD